MAFWVLGGGGNSLHVPGNHDSSRTSYFGNGKRKMGGGARRHPDDERAFYDYDMQKRARMAPWAGLATGPGADSDYLDPLTDSVPVRDLAFLVIHEGQTPTCSSPSPSPSPEPFSTAIASPVPSPGPGPVSHNDAPPGFGHGHGSASAPPCFPMERTESGLSISSAPTPQNALSVLVNDDDDDIATGLVLSDMAAARLVRTHLASFRRRSPDSQPERILRALITPKSRGADFPLDNDALRSIFSAANDLFFASRLARRVNWDWSHPACGQYESHIVGTTALRRCARLGGWETLIVLSTPILRDTKYNRRLLISTFLHEMIHSFMFVTCGLKASQDGGHTEGFRQIAAVIDEWAGKEHLRLTDMEADLDRFRGDDVFFPSHRATPSTPSPLAYEGNGGGDSYFNHCHGLNDDNMIVMGPQEWPPVHHGSPQHQRHITVPPPYPHHAGVVLPGGWQWSKPEDFGAHGSHPSGSPYVY